MQRRQLATLVLFLAPTLVSGSEAASSAPLELAPGSLGSARSEGMVFLSASESGKELYLFDAASGELTTFLESGERWGDPVVLKDPIAGTMAANSLRMDVGGGVVAIATAQRIYRFALDGTFLGATGGFFLPSDVALLSVGDLVVGLQNMPVPGGGFLRQEKLKDFDVPPRLVLVDEDFDVRDGGLTVEKEGWTSNLAAARSLKLTWNGHRIYAAEQSNYTIYELDRGLHLRDVFRDPELQYELGVPVAEGDEVTPSVEVPDEVARVMSGTGRHLVTTAPASSSETSGGMFANVPAIHDIAWDERSSRLIVLLNSRVGGRDVMDLLDPLTGEIRRIALERPGGAGGDRSFSQVAVGHRYVWFRNHPGEGPTYRLDRRHLQGGEHLVIPERLTRPAKSKADATAPPS